MLISFTRYSHEWAAVIVDEVHKLKNYKSQITQAMKALKCKVRIGLSGTILQNNLEELWCVVDWWDMSTASFCDHYLFPVWGLNYALWFWFWCLLPYFVLSGPTPDALGRWVVLRLGSQTLLSRARDTVQPREHWLRAERLSRLWPKFCVAGSSGEPKHSLVTSYQRKMTGWVCQSSWDFPSTHVQLFKTSFPFEIMQSK